MTRFTCLVLVLAALALGCRADCDGTCEDRAATAAIDTEAAYQDALWACHDVFKTSQIGWKAERDGDRAAAEEAAIQVHRLIGIAMERYDAAAAVVRRYVYPPPSRDAAYGAALDLGLIHDLDAESMHGKTQGAVLETLGGPVAAPDGDDKTVICTRDHQACCPGTFEQCADRIADGAVPPVSSWHVAAPSDELGSWHVRTEPVRDALDRCIETCDDAGGVRRFEWQDGWPLTCSCVEGDPT